MQEYTPTAEEMMGAMVAVLSDEEKRSDTIFVHGSPIRNQKLDRKLLNTVAETYRRGLAPSITLNSVSGEECEKHRLAYVGCEQWLSVLQEEGVPAKDIILAPPSLHTAAESRELLILAREHGWSTITIASYPHHQLRCFLQIVALRDIDIQIFNKTFGGVSWTEMLYKPVLDGRTIWGGSDVTGSFTQHVTEEFKRIVAYAQPPTGGKKYTRHATIPEMFQYLRERK